MADVYLAVVQGIVGFNKLLVVKEMRLETADDDLREAMFLDEARLAARLNHPGIVQTIEVGSEGRRRFLAMEYLDGQPLHRVIRRARERQKPISLTLHLRILGEVLTALEYAHSLVGFDRAALGIVHRDVSPHNVFVTYEGRVKLIDFGIAKTAVASQHTSEGVVKGKVKYMAPEQASAESVDRRSDIFAVGVMLWEAVVGHGPWRGKSDVEIFRALLSGDVPKLSDRKDRVDAALTAIVDHSMAADPADRYATALAMRDDLEAYVAACGDPPAIDRDLSTLISELFESDRNDLRKLIDGQLLEMNDPAPLEFASLTRLRSDGGDPEPTSASLARPVPEIAISVVPPSLAPPATARTRVFAMGAIAVAGAAVAALAASLLTHGTPSPSRPPPPVDTGVAPAPSHAPPPNGSPEAFAHVTIRVSPPSTRLYVDEVVVPNPYTGLLARDGSAHHARAESPGYVTKVHTFASNGDLDLDLALEREPVHARGSKVVTDAATHATGAPPAAFAATAAEPPSLPLRSTPVAAPAPPPVPTSPRPKREVDKDDPYAR
jgi:serine/threonine protein kinase